MKQKLTETERQTRRDAAIRSMRQVVALPSGSPERWRAAFIHFVRQRPEAEAEAALIASEVAKRRKLMNEYASSKHGRAIMAKPSYLDAVLKSTDPEYFINLNAMDLIAERHLRRLKKAFPEFFYAEVI